MLLVLAYSAFPCAVLPPQATKPEMLYPKITCPRRCFWSWHTAPSPVQSCRRKRRSPRCCTRRSLAQEDAFGLGIQRLP